MLDPFGVTMELTGWREVEPVAADRAAGMLQVWVSGDGGQLSLHHYDRPPHFSVPLDDLEAVRNHQRASLVENGGLVSCKVGTLHGASAVRTIAKFAMQPHGMTYTGVFELPFRDFSYAIRTQFWEQEPTGTRDTLVAIELNAMGADDWLQDPYDPGYQAAVLRNKSDDAQWDARFPGHPLTRVRETLAMVHEATRVSEGVRGAAPFVGPSKRGGRRWWGRG